MNRIMFVLTTWLVPVFAQAQSPEKMLDVYSQQARQEKPGFSASASRGERIYFAKQPERGDKPTSCTACHTENPKATGKTRAHKPIDPLAPAVNVERLTDPRKVEKWFRRNCNDVLGRECTAQEKADFVQYLISVK
jgi:cytochrome c553